MDFCEKVLSNRLGRIIVWLTKDSEVTNPETDIGEGIISYLKTLLIKKSNNIKVS